MNVESLICTKAKTTHSMVRCIVELSPLCNLSCEMCGISLKPNEVSQYGQILCIEEWKSLIVQLFEQGVLFLVFSGGEPLLYSGFEEIYTYAYKKGFLIELRTNGLLIPKYQDLFRKMPPKQIGISVYGDSDEMYYRMTGESNGYTKLLHALEISKTIRSQLHITCTMTKNNVSSFGSIAELADNYNASFGMITDIFPHVKGHRDNIHSRLSPAECAALAFYPPYKFKEALDKAIELEEKYADQFNLETLTDNQTITMCNGCQINSCLKWNGHMTFCPEIENVFTEPLKIGIEKAWKQLLQARSQCTIPNSKCSSCGIRNYCIGACPARFYLETGDYQKPSHIICEKAYYTKILSIEKG